MSSGESTTPPPPATGSQLPPPAATAPPASSTPPGAPGRDGIGATGRPGGSADWPAQAADAIVEVVGKVRDATTGPILTAARGVVYGTAIALLGATALVLVLVGAVRFLDTLIPGEVWSAYLVLGLVLTGIGLVLWSRRHAPSA